MGVRLDKHLFEAVPKLRYLKVDGRRTIAS